MDALSILAAGLFLSAIGNAYLFYLVIRQRQLKEPNLTLSAEELLHELTRGPAVVRLEVIDAKNLFLRRPRG